MKKKLNELITFYKKELINIKEQRKSDDLAGDHSFYMEYDSNEEKINEFIDKLKNIIEFDIV
jgi:hypothetical protein